MCDAMHFASELSGKYRKVRDALPAIALSDIASMTCIANDFGYAKVFSRQIEAIGNRGDVLLAITTSGNSENVIQAIYAASERGIKVVLLTGQDAANAYAAVKINVPSTITNHVQEASMKILHVIVELIEKSL
jgi:D-sedoheptulose 7-phosphate isomerase